MNAHRDLCKLATAWLLKQSWCDLACYELKVGRGFADAIGISRPRARTHRITIIEVKRTRSDLLQDIRTKKYLKYESQATHCYMAGTTEAFGNKTTNQIYVDLKNRGFPDHWGILIFDSKNEIHCLRSAKAHRKITYTKIKSLTRKIAKSFCYRVLQGKI